jgi:ATP-dependent RNA helicase DeaD
MENISFKKLGLQSEILVALEALGYEEPSEVQEKVIPFVLSENDIIVKSQTGSGKTAAFGIPVCEKIEIEEKKPQVLILTPTRELAVQVKEEISYIGRYKRIRCAAVFGKQPMTIQTRELKQRIHVIVGTPGRVTDHIERGNIELSEIKYLVIDEADKMLNMGFIDQVETIIKKLPQNRITMLFSATIPEKIEQLCYQYMHEPQKIEIEHKNKTSENIEQFYYEIEESNKFNLLCNIIYSDLPESAMIFLNTKDAVDRLASKMNMEGFSCKSLHGGMEQKDRLDAMEDFKNKKFRYLVATDVAARGIHIDEITHVINYDIPLELESYVHRIGRTGRAGSSGKAITLVTPFQDRFLKEIEDYIGYCIPKKDLSDSDNEHYAELKRQYNEKFKLGDIQIPKARTEKSFKINSGITKLYIHAGKKKKMRPGDIVGAITSIEGVTQEDIGIIDIQDNVSYVDILNDKGGKVLTELQKGTIKGKQVKVQKARPQK